MRLAFSVSVILRVLCFRVIFGDLFEENKEHPKMQHT